MNTEVREWASNVFDRTYRWENTNFLLREGFTGIKTGITPTAGPCLAAQINKDGQKIVIVFLDSKSMESRWFEAPKLVEWGCKKI